MRSSKLKGEVVGCVPPVSQFTGERNSERNIKIVQYFPELS